MRAQQNQPIGDEQRASGKFTFAFVFESQLFIYTVVCLSSVYLSV